MTLSEALCWQAGLMDSQPAHFCHSEFTLLIHRTHIRRHNCQNWCSVASQILFLLPFGWSLVAEFGRRGLVRRMHGFFHSLLFSLISITKWRSITVIRTPTNHFTRCCCLLKSRHPVKPLAINFTSLWGLQDRLFSCPVCKPSHNHYQRFHYWSTSLFNYWSSSTNKRYLLINLSWKHNK